MVTRYLPISWKEYHILARKLAASILDQSGHFDQIVAISRGGLTLGHVLTDFLRIPIATITIQSYSDIQTQGAVQLTAKLPTPIKGKRILLVDDVADSGKTLKRAVSYLRRLGPANITTVTMFYKSRSVFRPDFFGAITNKWILFPYEPIEMILLLTHQLENEGKTKAHIQVFLEKLGFADAEIAFARKHHLR